MEGRKENEEKVLKRIKETLVVAPKYIKEYYYTLNDKSYTTKYVYLNYVLDFLNFLDFELGLNIRDVRCFRQVKTSTINRYIAQLDGKESIKASRLYGIKNFFNYLISDEYLENNPCDRASIPRDKEEHKIISLTKEEIETVKNNVLTYCGKINARPSQKQWIKRDYAIVMVGLSLGLRVTSLAEINLEDIDFQNKEIKVVEKGNKIRLVKFGTQIEEILLDWINERKYILVDSGKKNSALFISNQIKRINVRSIEKMITKYTYNIDKHITPHKLRSTCATTLYNATGDIYLTADRLGHSNISNTRRYAQISEERKQKAVDAVDSILF